MTAFTVQNNAADKETSRIDIVATVRLAVARDDLQTAERLACGYRDKLGATSEVLEALSWVARGALKAHQFTKATANARQVHRVAVRRLRRARLHLEPHLAAALGASIEVLAQAMVKRGLRVEAIHFLNRELAKFGATSIGIRIRKNLNLLTMTGRSAPELEVRKWIGSKPSSLSKLRGRPVLLFFWAHYCEDSRAEGRVLARIRNQFGPSGLALIGPTRTYGYLDEHQRRPAEPRQEKQHIEQVLRGYYSDLSGMPVPISERNFDIYGVSTTPTLVLVDREGLVSFYHPGRMPFRELAIRVRGLLDP